MNNSEINEEIDLLHLFKYLLKRWKIIVLGAVICLMIGSAYCVFQNSKANDAIDALNEKIDNNSKVDTEFGAVSDLIKKYSEGISISEMEKERVANAISIYSVLDGYNAKLVNVEVDSRYSDGSAQNLQYNISSGNAAKSINTALSSYITSGGLAIDIAKGKVTDERLLAKRIVLLKNDNGDSVVEPVNVSFTVTCIGEDDNDAKELAEIVDKKLNAYVEKYKVIGNFSFDKLDQYESQVDSQLFDAQYQNIAASINTLTSQFNSSTVNFTDNQKALFNAVMGKNVFVTTTSLSTDDQKELPHVSMTAGIVKYAGIGAFAGLFIIVCVFSCIYIFGGKLKQNSDLERYYNYYILGDITSQAAGIEMLYANLKAICQKNNLNKVCVHSSLDFSEDTMAKLNTLIDAMKAEQIEVVFVGNTCKSVSGFETMVDTGAVVLMEREMETRLSDIKEISENCREHDVKIVGAISC